MKIQRRWNLFLGGVAAITLAAAASAVPRPEPSPAPVFAADKGTFAIRVNGKPAGKEEFEISPNGQDWVVRGSTEIPAANGATHVTGTLHLRADGSPVQYDWSTDGEKQASCTVRFDGGTASIEPHIPGAYPYSQQFTFNSQPVIVLDNNLYDQYAVLARLYDWSKKGVQTFSVLVPQAITGGTLTAESLGSHDVGGKKLEELRVTTEGNELDLFLDGQRLVRINAPSANAEIIRD